MLEVFSEIGKLRRVLIHLPGREIDWMVPSMMERLLFDDILYGEAARHEHTSFRKILELAGVETLDPERLLQEVLEDPTSRHETLKQLERVADLAAVWNELVDLSPADLSRTLIAGIRRQPEGSGGRLHDFYTLPPVPNYFFQRDPQVVLGNHVLMAAMATEARGREPLLAEAIFRWHPVLGAGQSEGRALWKLEDTAAETHRRATIEGGDVLVASPEVLLVGVSERTNRWGVHALAERMGREESPFRSLIVVELPNRRSYMHLDTVFTFIDHGLCLAYLPVIEAGGFETGHVYRVDIRASRAGLTYSVCSSLRSALAAEGIDIELVPCGGGDSLIDQQREQWTDGANAFAIAPGVIVVYQRNRRTVEELDRRGWRVLTEADVIDRQVPVLGQGPTVIVLVGHELSRARGGPRCMTMPLERQALDA